MLRQGALQNPVWLQLSKMSPGKTARSHQREERSLEKIAGAPLDRDTKIHMHYWLIFQKKSDFSQLNFLSLGTRDGWDSPEE